MTCLRSTDWWTRHIMTSWNVPSYSNSKMRQLARIICSLIWNSITMCIRFAFRKSAKNWSILTLASFQAQCWKYFSLSRCRWPASCKWPLRSSRISQGMPDLKTQFKRTCRLLKTWVNSSSENNARKKSRVYLL